MVTVQPNQSILDVVLNEYGSLEAAMTFCTANGISLSTIPVAGTTYQVPASIEGNAISLAYLRSRDITIGTADVNVEIPGPLIASIVLRPYEMSINLNGYHLGEFGLRWVSHVAFYNRYPLLEDWVVPPKLILTSIEQWDIPPSGLAGAEAELLLSAGQMFEKILEFPPTTESVGAGVHFWYSDPSSFWENAVARFEDVEGNSAVCAPVVVYYSPTATLYTIIGQLQLHIGTQIGESYIQPITILHPPDNPVFNVLYHKIIYQTSSGEEVSTGALATGDTVELHLTAGIYHIILATTYTRPFEGVDPGPYSFNSLVLEVTNS
ncbi:hypothetical protein GCM10023093_17090 [Nemorincola caseinilytica]|uniref:Uncharacterized protein n=1 Tax=Nemorincola caseinilytica TaxID=2054315 RepID=A0ABP8NGY3_9BACT